MPGIVGCSTNTGTVEQILIARDCLKYSPSYKNDTVFQDENIICTRTHLGIVGEQNSPTQTNGWYCWVEGEMYNIKELRSTFSLTCNSESQLLIEALQKKKLKKLLQQIDGFFVAVIYEKKTKRIHFITSRYGFKPLYIWQEDGRIAWSSELKALLKLKSFPQRIDKTAINCFLQLGHFLGPITWFQNVSQLDASCWYIYSLEKPGVSEHTRYWSWENVEPNSLSFMEAAEHSGTLFKEAIKRQCQQPNKKYMISLSGGLDSRAIMAAIPDDIKVSAFTFGVKNCEDITIAKQVTHKKPAPHSQFFLNDKNWFNGRAEGIWRSDGMISFIHFHATQFESQIGKTGQISFNGFAGEVVLGCHWMKNLNNRATLDRAQSVFGKYTYLDQPNAQFYNISTEAPYYLNTRVRKFTAYGLSEIKEFESRIPFFDNQLIEFVYSLPDEFRQHNRLYNQILLNEFPSFFDKIPWQGTGCPISNYKTWYYYPRRVAKILLKKANIDLISFATYNKWLKRNQEIFTNILLSEQAILPRILNVNFKNETEPFSDLKKTMLLFSAEIWLQQIFNHRFLTTEELLEIGK